jgi:PAS domain S-box-containing protein
MISVLYVDDEPGLLEITRIFLEASGEFTVATSESAKESLELLSTRTYDAIISDYQMPDMDGIAFLKAVRERYNDIPFVLFTGRGREEIVINAINNGADFYLQKGGDPRAQFAELSHKIHQAVRRRETERELRRSEEKYRLVVENGNNAVYIYRDRQVLFINSRVTDLTGYTHDELMGMDIWDLVHLDDRARMQESGRRRISGSILPPNFTGRIIQKGGEVRDCEFFISRIVYQDQPALLGIIRDITEQKREEDIVRESEKKYQTLAELLPQMIFEIDLDFMVTYANWHTLTSLGFTNLDIENRVNALSFIAPSQHQAVKETVKKFLDGVPLEPHEYTVVRKDKSTFPAIIYSAPVYRNRKLVGFRGVAVDISARKIMEDALRESEEKFRGMAERSSDLIIILNKEMSPTYVSPSARIIVGFDPEELVGKPPEFAKATIFSKTGPELMNAVRSTMSGLPVENVELSLTKKDKIPVIVSMCAVPVLHDGILEGAQVTMRDITGQRKTEIALRESEVKFRSFVENASEIVFSLTPEGFFSYISPNCTELLGYDPGDVIGKPSSVFIHPDDYPRNQELFRQSVRTGKKTRGLEYRVQHSDGSWRWYSQSISPVYNDGGNVIAVNGICHDITDRKLAESELKKSQFLLSEAMDMAHMADWELDVLTGVFTFNDRFYALYGTTAEREGGYQMPAEVYAREFTHPDDQHMVGEEIAKALSAPDSGYFALREHRIIRREGEVRDILVRIRVTKDAEGRTTRAHGANQDITDRKRAEEALRQANKKLNLLSGITRHDINNQLLALNGFVSLLHHHIPEPSCTKYFSRITEASRNIAEMIRFTREYEKIGTGTPVWQDLTAMINTTGKGFIPGQVAIKTDFPAATEIFADPMLGRVFFNLLDNAVRHGERVTEIHVTTYRSKENLVIVWEDNGIGIAADDKERIFERGFGKNTGLGMFLVREILSLTGITILENGEQGRGARFEMTVPHGSFR